MKRFVAIIISTITILFSFTVYSVEEPRSINSGLSTSQELFMYIGSPLTLSDGNIKALDSTNLGLVPILYNDRTLIPLRAVSEHFGAEVNFDEAKNAGVIRYNGRTALFPINESYFIIDRKTYELDTSTQMIGNRIMVPLRALSENFLMKNIDYSDNIISITDQKTAISDNKEKVDLIKSKIGMAIKPASQKELIAMINSSNKNLGNNYGMTRDTVASSELAQNTTSSAKESSSSTDNSYSTTNVQVDGIDEGDIVKTDGKFIYVAGGERVSIVKAEGEKLTVMDTIKTADKLNLNELYIDKNTLIVIGTRYVVNTDPEKEPSVKNSSDSISEQKLNLMKAAGEIPMDAKIGIMPPYYSRTAFAYAGIYSINENGIATLVKEVEVEGNKTSTRKSGEYLYLITNKYVNISNPDNGDDIMPYIRDTSVNNEYKALPIDNVIVFPEKPTNTYLNVTAIDISKPQVPSKTESLLGAGNQIYMSDSALYVASYLYEEQKTKTLIVKFKIDGLNIGYAASGKVKGNILNQFSMDEYKGSFRIATTTQNKQNENALYILDQNLNIIGSIEGLAKDERIYSVRFMGDKGYIVTFRNIDPLFVLDLSNPQSPKVTGELKIPGFSNYLHPVGENLLLGIGYDTEEMYIKDRQTGKDTVIGTRQGGMKFSLFDVSDSGKPVEIANYILGKTGSYAQMQHNHKAIMFNLKDNMFAFDASINNDAGQERTNFFRGAVVMSFDKNGFKINGQIPFEAPLNEYSGYYYDSRLCYIGNTLYYVQQGMVRAFDLSTFKELGSVKLK